MSEQDVPDGPISREEMIDLFGEEMPMEAVKLVWEVPGHMTLREVRQELRRIAKRAPQNPRVTQADRDAAESLMSVWGYGHGAMRIRKGEADSEASVQAFARHREAAEAASKAREAALVEALGNAKWLLEGIKRAGWVTSPSYGDDINLGLERINAALTKEPDA